MSARLWRAVKALKVRACARTFWAAYRALDSAIEWSFRLSIGGIKLRKYLSDKQEQLVLAYPKITYRGMK